MGLGPADCKVTVAGGDRRQSEVARALYRYGFPVHIFNVPDLEDCPELVRVTDWLHALVSCKVLVLPISGVTADNAVRTHNTATRLYIDEDFWLHAPGELMIVTGSWPAHLKEKAEARKLRICEYAERDEIAIPNAIPTAEGALQIAMNELPVTIHGSRVLVLGYGRVAAAVARLFAAAGAMVYIAARRAEARTAAVSSGYQAVDFHSLPSVIGSMDVVINTVPAMVLTARELAAMKKDGLIIDLASAPGGVDFQAAAGLGIKAILALGLPGKVAPRTAGEILASTLPKIILYELGFS